MAIAGEGSRQVRRVIDAALVGTAAFALGLALAGRPVFAFLDLQRASNDTSAAAPAERTPGGMAGCADRVYDRLFFGLGTPEGSVSTSEWRRFLAEVVTPRFPGGLTVVEANGQWRALGERQVTVERSRVVEIAHDDTPEFDRWLSEVVAVYKHRYRQRSVMLTRARVEVCW
jgi:Protein of unknown function (DUF3574)